MDTLNCNSATFHGLHEWHKHMFEKLGWMILSKEKNDLNPEKISAYIKGIELLKCSLEKKINIVKEEDRKVDLEILLDNVKILQKAASKILVKPTTNITGGNVKKIKKSSRK